VEWEKATEELFSRIVEQMPQGFRPSVEPMIIKATFTPDGLYYKIENDYNGTMVDFLLMGAKAGLESYK